MVNGGAEKGAPLSEKHEEHKCAGNIGKTDNNIYSSSTKEKKM